MGSFSVTHWLIVLAIVVLIFGTKKLANVGKDLGAAVKGFKEGIREGEAEAGSTATSQQLGQTVQGEATTVKETSKSV